MDGTFQNIPIHGVSASDRIRESDARQVSALAESIREVGLLNPITVAPESYSYKLIAGLHRLEACRSLGMEQIAAFVVDLDDQRRIIAECDENLCAPTLTPAERATFTAKRKAAYEALHPETAHGAIGGGHDQSRQLGDSAKADRFTADTAARTGQSERVVQRNAERGEKIAPEAIEAVRGTKLDKGSYLDALKKVPAEEQAAKVKADLEAPEKPKTAAVADTPPDDPYADERKELRGLTREGLEDEVIGLREENAEYRAAIAKLKRENEELKCANRDLSSSNQGAVISRLTKQLQGMKFEKQNALEDARKATWQLNKMKKEQAS
ncbi:ParB/RepB/Spo0J family partition protein [Martelella limonii]|uniref:ParB/RepB/Spo0J family partition protein n=1 Tax=Martelella limonii TaxID=1647649 RepID=UPI001580CC1C|nr:ParB N-terminal domain-containing protein [Martelella limonii]